MFLNFAELFTKQYNGKLKIAFNSIRSSAVFVENVELSFTTIQNSIKSHHLVIFGKVIKSNHDCQNNCN